MNIVGYLISLSFRILILLLIIMVILVKPRKKRDTSYFRAKMYAHRGLHGGGVPENSITAFKLAKEKGYGVELDVQMTLDGELVVFHDGSLKRVCGVDGNLRDYTLAELKTFSLLDTDEKIPTFNEVLDVLEGTDIICEIKGDNGNKNYELCQKTYDALMAHNCPFCIESFSPFLVRWFKENHPEIIRGQLSCDFMESENIKWIQRFCMTHLLVNVLSKPDFIAYKHEDIDKFGFRLCKRIYHPFTVAWTAKGDEEQIRAWGSFDSVIFENFSGKE